MKSTFVLCALVVLGALTACSAPGGDKLGQDGERCFTDNDCALPLVCSSGICTGSGGEDNNDDNNDNNDGNNMLIVCGDDVCEGDETPDNCPSDCESLPGFTCEEACDRLVECVDDSPNECVLGCEDNFDGVSEDVRQRSLACIVNASCDDFFNGDVERCFEGAMGGGGDNNEPVPPPNPGPEPDPGPEPAEAYRFVLIQDIDPDNSPSSGADIDALGGLGPQGQAIVGAEVPFFDVGQSRSDNPDEALGEPQGGCDNYVSLAGGFVVFGLNFPLETGGFLTVFETESDDCRRAGPDSDGYTVAVSNDLDSFLIIGEAQSSADFFIEGF